MVEKSKLTEEREKVRAKISSEELIEIKGSLEKARSKLEIDVILKILGNLGSLHITKEHLQVTKIGKTLTSVTQLQLPNDRQDLAKDVELAVRQASKLVDEWKAVFNAEKLKKAEPKPAQKPAQ